MKKYLIAIIAILTISFTQNDTNAQSDSIFAPTNAEWWHDMDYGYNTNKIHSEVVSDTLFKT